MSGVTVRPVDGACPLRGERTPASAEKSTPKPHQAAVVTIATLPQFIHILNALYNFLFLLKFFLFSQFELKRLSGSKVETDRSW